ncbi:hypothetical protein AURDEDRAFT_154076 [Auricularia subglabra TFB-10046 SS5]|nr:hypothetical protein AURDEDRAFT_154076 [Auricularia subglabra TFB-10046 SS5]
MVPSALAGRSDPAAALPPELVLKCIWGFSFDDLRPLLAVSARWRAIALASKVYWSFIHLQWFTPGAVNLFLTRLARTGTRPVSLIIELRPPKPELVQLQDVILAAVRDHLHHLTWLVFLLRASDAPKLWDALAGPASELRHFDLRVDTGSITDPLPVIPAELFAGQAPHLHTVSMRDLALPPRPVHVFFRVTSLTLRYTVSRPMDDVFRHFPHVTDANLPSPASFGNPAFARSALYRNIKVWSWQSGRKFHNIPFPLAAVHDIETVRVYFPLPREISGLIAHLTPPLSFTFEPNPLCPDEEFNLSVTGQSDANRPWRILIDKYRFWSPTKGPDLRHALHAALAGRANTLLISAPMWASLLQCVPPVPGLRYLRILGYKPEDLFELLPAPFLLCDLLQLELKSKAGCVTLPVLDVLMFAKGSFNAAVLLRATLLLVNVHLDGSPNSFTRVFGDVVFAHSGPCSYRSPRRRLRKTSVP